MQSNGFQTAYQELEENIRKDPDTYAVPGEIQINFQETGDRDLYLGIGKCTIEYVCMRVDSNVIINFKIEDKYNFDEIRTFRENNDKIVKFNFGIGALANDAGLLSQADEVISNYKIYISFQKTVMIEGA